MSELVAFLRARLDEDEQAARKLLDEKRPGRAERWEFCDDGAIRDTGPRRSLRVKFTWPPEADHIVRHDPARVLADVEAKRELLRLHTLNGWVCSTCDNGEVPGDGYPCPTLRLLALPYASHADYDEAWRP
ncbi:DUF6221 family protein [Streptomyces wuyuanensis]|uniref:DUF6221 family protein n=1 Tax=Streptomyces wuyuanensis TaxID=1196353 RepID=UPI0037996584